MPGCNPFLYISVLIETDIYGLLWKPTGDFIKIKMEIYRSKNLNENAISAMQI